MNYKVGDVKTWWVFRYTWRPGVPYDTMQLPWIEKCTFSVAMLGSDGTAYWHRKDGERNDWVEQDLYETEEEALNKCRDFTAKFIHGHRVQIEALEKNLERVEFESIENKKTLPLDSTVLEQDQG